MLLKNSLDLSSRAKRGICSLRNSKKGADSWANPALGMTGSTFFNGLRLRVVHKGDDDERIEETSHADRPASGSSPQSGEWFESVNPFTAAPWALDSARKRGRYRPRRGRRPIRLLRRLAQAERHCARRSLLRRLADLIAAEAERLAEIETTDNGKLIAEMRDAVEIHSAMVPLLWRTRGQDRRPRDPDRQAGRIQFHARRAARRDCRDYSVELAADAGGVEARAGARRGKHRRVEAFGVFVGFGARVRGVVRARGISAGSGQHRHGFRQRGRRAVDHASARREDRVHRRRSNRRARVRAGGERDQEDYARARRKVGEHRFRRCRSRRGGEGRRLRNFRRHRANLHRRIARADPSPDSRPSSSNGCWLWRKPRTWAIRSRLPRRSARSPRSPQYEKVLDYIRIAKEEGAVCRLGGAPAERAGMRLGMVRRADHLHRRESRDADRARKKCSVRCSR